MLIGITLATTNVSRERGIAGRWNPLIDLGPKLLGWWSAEPAYLTLNVLEVTEWRDVTHGYVMTPTGAPTYDATGWTGGRPAVESDGAGYFACVDAAFLASLPSGAAAGELWGLVRQDDLPADTTERVVMSYGAGSAFNNARRMTRVVSVGVNRGQIMVGTGAAAVIARNDVADFSGDTLVRGQYGATQSVLTIDGSVTAPLAAVPATTVTKATLFASSGTVPTQIWKGGARDFMFTTALNAEEALLLNAWLAAR